MSVKELQKKIVPILKRQGVKRAAVFGSFARGEGQRGSDVDILIEYQDDSKSLLDFVGLKLELEDLLKKKVDLVEYVALHPFLRDSILKEQIFIL